MAFAGFNDPTKVNNVIAYLQQFGENGEKVSGK